MIKIYQNNYFDKCDIYNIYHILIISIFRKKIEKKRRRKITFLYMSSLIILPSLISYNWHNLEFKWKPSEPRLRRFWRMLVSKTKLLRTLRKEESTWAKGVTSSSAWTLWIKIMYKMLKNYSMWSTTVQ